MYEERVKGAGERAYQYVADMPGYSETYIDKEVKEKFFDNIPDKPIPLLAELAFRITKEESNLKSLEKHPQALYGGRLYSKNHKRK